MGMRHGLWALVLAAGDGTRLATLTTDEFGYAVPKQFCSLTGGATLLEVALARARRIVPQSRVCAIVARQHGHHWRSILWSLPAKNVIVQPRNCGTAIGVLLGLLRILERDPLASVLFLPADHYIFDEELFAACVRRAEKLVTRGRDGIALVGVVPDCADPELGYIVPGTPVDDGVSRVAQFVEKPTAAAARALIARGAVWNSFIFWAHATTLLTLMRSRMPEIVANMTTALARDRRRGEGNCALDELYERLPVIDFSRTIVQGAESALRVSSAPSCGWTDLGTPRRVAQTVQRFRLAPSPVPSMGAPAVSASVNLASRCANHYIGSQLF